MRRAWILLLSAGLLPAGLGCSCFCAHTAGKCDCNPPPVDTVLHPYTGPVSAPPAALPYGGGPIAPHAVEPPKLPG